MQEWVREVPGANIGVFQVAGQISPPVRDRPVSTLGRFEERGRPGPPLHRLHAAHPSPTLRTSCVGGGRVDLRHGEAGEDEVQGDEVLGREVEDGADVDRESLCTVGEPQGEDRAVHHQRPHHPEPRTGQGVQLDSPHFGIRRKDNDPPCLLRIDRSSPSCPDTTRGQRASWQLAALDHGEERERPEQRKGAGVVPRMGMLLIWPALPQENRGTSSFRSFLRSPDLVGIFCFRIPTGRDEGLQAWDGGEIASGCGNRSR